MYSQYNIHGLAWPTTSDAPHIITKSSRARDTAPREPQDRKCAPHSLTPLGNAKCRSPPNNRNLSIRKSFGWTNEHTLQRHNPFPPRCLRNGERARAMKRRATAVITPVGCSETIATGPEADPLCRLLPRPPRREVIGQPSTLPALEHHRLLHPGSAS